MVSERKKPVVDSPARLSRLFHALSDAEFELLVSDADVLELKLGSSIFRAEERINCLYVLLSGKVRLTVRSEDKDATLLSLVRTGDVFGAVEANSPSFYGARSSADCQLLRIPCANVQRLRDSNQAFANLLLRELRLISWQHALFASSISSSLSPANLHTLLSHGELAIIEHGGRIKEEWAHSDSLTIILSGSFHGPAGEELVVGDHFNSAHLHSANESEKLRLPSAKDRSQVLIFSPSSLHGLFQDFAELENEVLSYRRKVGSKIENLRQSTRMQRIQSLKVAEPGENEARELARPPESLFSRLKKRFGYYPILYQQNAMDCGSSCIAMVALQFGQRLDLNKVRTLAHVGAAGTSLYSLAQASEALGFTCRGISATYEGLLKSRFPLICFWRNEHYVVLFELDKTHAIIGDPAEGLLRLTPEEFAKNFSGVALELTPTEKLGSQAKQGSPFARLSSFILPFKWEATHVFVATLFYQTLMLIIPLFTQAIVDKVVVHQSLPLLNTMTLGMIIFAGFETIVTFIRGYIQAYLAIRLDQSIIIQFYRHLLSLPFKFFEDRTIGDIIVRFNENQKIRDFLSGSSITVLLDVVVLALYLVVIFTYNISFGAAVVAYLCAFALLVVIYTPILKHFGRMVFNRTSDSQSFVIESIRSIQLVKGAAAEQRIRWKWELMLGEQLEARFKELLASNTVQSVSRLLQLTGQILLLYMGAQLVVKGQLTIGQLMALNMMFGMIILPVMRIIEMWSGFQDVNVAMERLCDVLDHDPEEPAGASRIQVERIKGHLVFENVTFRYNDDAKINALDNVSLEILPGQLAAFVGRSGSGKTTILKLIQGLYLPNSGKVSADGIDLKHISLSSYRRQTGVVSQNEYLFRGTVRENLSFNKPDATMQEIVEAATVAGIHNVVMNMPMGYDTLLSEGGYNLSGGERQRMAIARAVIHKPALLLFDEATSALDTESERHIQESMDSIRKDYTMIVLAHRLSTIKNADIIFVVDRGRIVESGSYETLLEAKGLFYHLCKQQLGS